MECEGVRGNKKGEREREQLLAPFAANPRLDVRPSAASPTPSHTPTHPCIDAGQIVPTSTAEGELCINGMSFSRRDSRWANSALVVEARPEDWAHLVPRHGPLAGMALQQEVRPNG